MAGYVARRLIEVVIVCAVMSFVIYALIGLMPGDPVDAMISANPRLTSEDAKRLKELYGVSQPLLDRYLAWLRAALAGDFGYSRLYLRPTLETLLPRLGNTALVMGASFLLSLVLAVPLGILAARRPGGRFDTIVNFLSFAGISIPPFWLALLLILVFAVSLGWFPAGTAATIGDGGLADRAWHLVLPVATLTIASVGGYIRFMRAATIEALRQDYIRTARRATRLVAPRRAQRAHPGDHGGGAVLRLAVLRRAHYRDHVRLSRHGQAHLRRRPRQ
jgi:peptide/nickel transport system permease protein